MAAPFKTVCSVVLIALSLLATSAEAAKRFGGGRSFGQQSGNVTQRYNAPTAPGAPAAQPGINKGATAAPSPAGAAAAAPARKPWGAMLGGLAAGLGLAWLAHSLGLGEAMGSMLMVILFVVLAVAVVGWFMRGRGRAQGGLAYAGAGSADAAPRAYKPENVGNDASARPWERNTTSFSVNPGAATAAGGSMIGAGLRSAQGWGVPDGFDAEGFLRAAKENFTSLQAAWDRGDIPVLRAMMTDTMLAEIQAQLAEREKAQDGDDNHTEVVMLDAHLLGIEDLGSEYLASVEFSGMIREDASAGPNPFREVWNMSKAKSGTSGWLVSGLQALQ